MIRIQTFVFNPLQVNTYLLFDETNECVVIDPACSNADEENELIGFIEHNHLVPVALLNTHGHFDHVFGNNLISTKYGLAISGHKNDLSLVENAIEHARLFGVMAKKSPSTTLFLQEGDVIHFGQSILQALHVPGHSTGSLSYYSEAGKFVITGDALFHGSIGRTDLPGGNFDTLIENIRGKLLTLPDDVKVYPGHGEASTIGYEKSNNPYL
jgi:hydroxyacylglutathione hydrolase